MQDLTDSGFITLLNKLSKQVESDSFDLDLYANILLAYNCMPTLLHIKPANLLQVNKQKYIYANELIHIIDNYARMHGCACFLIHENELLVSLLIYNRQILDEILTDKEIEQYLTACGYSMTPNRLENSLARLKESYGEYFNYKYKSDLPDGSRKFPHEIGLLLGYPLKDVDGFIKNRGLNYLLCGYWKVYHDKDRAKKIFEEYDRARAYAINLLINGCRLRE